MGGAHTGTSAHCYITLFPEMLGGEVTIVMYTGGSDCPISYAIISNYAITLPDSWCFVFYLRIMFSQFPLWFSLNKITHLQRRLRHLGLDTRVSSLRFPPILIFWRESK